jgi:hypothetical protein
MLMVASGVFLGLAADAAWDAREDRRLEDRYLLNLAEEMRGAQEELRIDEELRAHRLSSLESLQAEFETRKRNRSPVAMLTTLTHLDPLEAA